MLLKAGTELDRLSQLQTDLVCELLSQTVPELRIEKKALPDSNRDDTIFVFGKSGIPRNEALRAVKDRRVDFVVQNMKHILAFDEDVGLSISAVLERSSPAEVLVSRENLTVRSLKPGSIVEVSNPTRMAQVRRVRPDVQARPAIGRVETRLSRIDAGECDAVILAEAGLARLGLTERISERLQFRDFLPGPGQGIVAVVTRKGDEGFHHLLEGLQHQSTRIEAEAERQLLRTFRAECKVPVCALASASGEHIQITARVLSKDGMEKIDVYATGDIREANRVGPKAAKELIAKGAVQLEPSWKGRGHRSGWNY